MTSKSRRLTDEKKVKIMEECREKYPEVHQKHLEKTAIPRMKYVEAEKPVVEELRIAGYKVDHIQDLYHRYKTYKSAIPILLKWLSKIAYSDIKIVREVKTTILSALDNKCAKPEAIPFLIQEFKNFKGFEGLNDYLNYSYHWKIGATLGTLSDDAYADDLFQLVKNKEYGACRAQLIRGLKNLKDYRTIDVLIDLLKDNDLVEFTVYTLGMLGAKKARPYIEKFLNDSETSIRQEAKKAIKRIDAQ